VSDARLRDLERRWRASGDPADREAWERGRRRAGEAGVVRVLRCAACRAALTRPLAPRAGRLCPADDGSDGEPLVPRGRLAWVVGGQVGGMQIGDGAHAVHREDLTGAWRHRDPARSLGCCGPTGEHLNLLCPRGHEVGAEVAECSLAHFAYFPPERVTVSPDLEGAPTGVSALGRFLAGARRRSPEEPG